MCQAKYTPLLVISIEGDKNFIDLPIEIDEIYLLEEGPGQILEYICNMDGLVLEHIYLDLEKSIRFFIGIACPECETSLNGGGFYSVEVPNKESQSLFLQDFEKRFGFKELSFFKAAISMIIMDVIETYMNVLDADTNHEYFIEMEAYRDEEDDEVLAEEEVPEEAAEKGDKSTTFFSEVIVDLDKFSEN